MFQCEWKESQNITGRGQLWYQVTKRFFRWQVLLQQKCIPLQINVKRTKYKLANKIRKIKNTSPTIWVPILHFCFVLCFCFVFLSYVFVLCFCVVFLCCVFVLFFYFCCCCFVVAASKLLETKPQYRPLVSKSKIGHQSPKSKIGHQYPKSKIGNQFPNSNTGHQCPKSNIGHQGPKSKIGR